ncbi:MAG: hypothetical protein NZM35_00935 [Chitinophagales bacterium]|nr:hypothetical protein [Chitinophagales bacterium]MDW8418991.1 hypothetical protein [Chitinophagales bacterium]
MQAPTHILAGSVIQELCKTRRFPLLTYFLTAVFGFFSHGLLDKLAITTYHPPRADFSDAFWISYHVGVLLATIVAVYVYGARYGWGIIFAVLPDVDWILIHGQRLTGISLPFYQTPHIHNFLNAFFDTVAAPLSALPDYRHYPWAGIFEIALIALFILLLHRLQRRRRNIHFR